MKVICFHETLLTNSSQVGQKIAEKIDEFLTTGKLRKLEKIRTDDTSVAINLMTRVAGIGPAKAQDLVREGITTLDALRKNQDKLNKQQKIGLKHFEDFEKRIPRAECKEVRTFKRNLLRKCHHGSHFNYLFISFYLNSLCFQTEKLLNATIQSLDPKYSFMICGSYRRGVASSGDIDVLLMHENYTSDMPAKKKGFLLKEVVQALEESDLITDTISLGDHKFMGVCRYVRGGLKIRAGEEEKYDCVFLSSIFFF